MTVEVRSGLTPNAGSARTIEGPINKSSPELGSLYGLPPGWDNAGMEPLPSGVRIPPGPPRPPAPPTTGWMGGQGRPQPMPRQHPRKTGIAHFVREVLDELRRVTWPTRQMVIHNSGIAFGTVAWVLIVIAALEFASGRALGLIL